MAGIDYEARLTKVQAAIDALLDGGMASYTIDGQSVTRLDLDRLLEEEQVLVARINRQARTRRVFRTGLPG